MLFSNVIIADFVIFLSCCCFITSVVVAGVVVAATAVAVVDVLSYLWCSFCFLYAAAVVVAAVFVFICGIEIRYLLTSSSFLSVCKHFNILSKNQFNRFDSDYLNLKYFSLLRLHAYCKLEKVWWCISYSLSKFFFHFFVRKRCFIGSVRTFWIDIISMWIWRVSYSG